MDETEKCFLEGNLKKMQPSVDLAKKSIKQARIFLQDALDLSELEKERMSIIALYNAFFHASRALLFRDGIKERSHYCIARYLEKFYFDKKILPKEFLLNLDFLREIRHETQYSLEAVHLSRSIEDIAAICEDFIDSVEKLL